MAAGSGKRRRGDEALRRTEQLVDGTFRRLGLHEQAAAWRALWAWAQAAGPRIAERARAERLRGGTLLVRVSSSTWANELSFLKEELLAKLRTLPGGRAITDLRFTVGPLDDAPSWTEPPRPPSPPEAARPPHPPVPMPPSSEQAAVDEALDAVPDPALRDALGRLIARARGAR